MNVLFRTQRVSCLEHTSFRTTKVSLRCSCPIVNDFTSRLISYSQFKSIWINSSRFESIRIDLNRFESIWIDSNRFESIRIDWNRFESIRIDSSRFESIRIDSKRYRFESIRIDFNRFESIWVHSNRIWSQMHFRTTCWKLLIQTTAKFSNGQKITRMAPIWTKIWRNRSQRPELNFEKKSARWLSSLASSWSLVVAAAVPINSPVLEAHVCFAGPKLGWQSYPKVSLGLKANDSDLEWVPPPNGKKKFCKILYICHLNVWTALNLLQLFFAQPKKIGSTICQKHLLWQNSTSRKLDRAF